MAFTGVAGMPDYSGQSKFIPEIWAGKFLEKFYDATVLAAISNTDYEGEIKDMGDTVYIRTKPTLTIRDYVRGQKLQTERPDSVAVTLQINKGKYFAAEAEDIDRVQTDMELMNTWSEDASEQMKIVIDQDVLQNITTDIVAANKGNSAGRISGNIALGAAGTPVSLTKANVLDFIIDLGLALDEQNIPETGRWVILPAWMAALIKKSDLKDASLTGDGTSVLRNGRLGMIDRFTLYSSNLVYKNASSEYYIYAGHKLGFTFATQMTKMETLRSQDTFGDIIRGLQIYGYKVVKGDALSQGIVVKG
jgi:hypothetical protein